MTALIAIASTVAAGLAVAAMTTRAVRARFDPFDAFLLALAGYVGYLIVAGLVLDLTPVGLTRPSLFTAVAVPGVLALAYLGLVLRDVRPGDLRRRLARRADPRARTRGELVRAALATVLAVGTVMLLVVALDFARSTEQELLTPAGVAVYLDPTDDTVSIHNPSPATQRLEVTVGPTTLGQDPDPALSGTRSEVVVLKPGATWTVATKDRGGRYRVLVTQEDGAVRFLDLNGLRPDLESAEMGENR